MQHASCPRPRLLPTLAFALALVAFAVPAFAGIECIITGPETSCGPAELCGPEGAGAYYWSPPGGGVQTTRCITATETGTYFLRIGPDANNLGEPCYFKFEISEGIKCDITGNLLICPGAKTELCGPEGEFTYEWSDAGGVFATTRCVTVGVGAYSLKITNAAKCEATCRAEVLAKKECVTNCPRTPGFWGQQCAQKKGGSTKFTVAQVTSIASCVDAHADIFNWGGGSFAGFCAAISTSDMNQRVQAKRQFASFLANICTDQLDLITNNGEEIILDLGTPVSCGGHDTTIGDLIDLVDDRLMELQGQDIDLQAVKDAYGAIITCLDRINNGIGIGPVCPAIAVLTTTAGASGAREEAFLELASPFPNPVTHSMSMEYAIGGAGAHVKIAVYDLAGRKVLDLVNGFQDAGRYETRWNTMDAAGSRVRAGVYFVRGVIGGQVVTRQVIVH